RTRRWRSSSAASSTRSRRSSRSSTRSSSTGSSSSRWKGASAECGHHTASSMDRPRSLRKGASAEVAELTDNTVVAAPAVDALVTARGEPAWLADERRAALRTFEATKWPGPRDELWRYTQLERFSVAGLDLVPGPRDRDVSERIRMRIKDSDAEGIMVVKNGEPVLREARVREAGVIFTDMATALREHEDLVRQHLYTAVNAPMTKFTALN